MKFKLVEDWDRLEESTTKEMKKFATMVKKAIKNPNYTYIPHRTHDCVDIMDGDIIIGQAFPKRGDLSKDFYTLVKLNDPSEAEPGDILYAKRPRTDIKPQIIGIDYIKNVKNKSVTVDEFINNI